MIRLRPPKYGGGFGTLPACAAACADGIRQKEQRLLKNRLRISFRERLPAALITIAIFTAAIIALSVLIGFMQCGKC